jgi:hypothetical protein
MVIYRGSDGKPGYHQADAIEDAVRYVESLRNGDGVEVARIFRMDEVTFEFRPYFKVEIATAGSPEAAAAPTEVVEVLEVPAAAEETTPAPAADVEEPSPWTAEPAEEPVSVVADVGNGAVGRRGLFGR